MKPRPIQNHCTLLILSGILLFLSVACSSTPEPRKRSFVGDSIAEQESEIRPEGLNPLGPMETCGKDMSPTGGKFRVLVSPPRFFTREASIMIVSLRKSLQSDRDPSGRVKMVLSNNRLRNSRQAQQEGSRCGAMIVLWEQTGTSTLELTLPNPAIIPLRGLAERKLCEFGNHSEQLTILYLTIRGLTALENHQYDKANYFLRAANQIDNRCLFLPMPGKTGKN